MNRHRTVIWVLFFLCTQVHASVISALHFSAVLTSTDIVKKTVIELEYVFYPTTRPVHVCYMIPTPISLLLPTKIPVVYGFTLSYAAGRCSARQASYYHATSQLIHRR